MLGRRRETTKAGRGSEGHKALKKQQLSRLHNPGCYSTDVKGHAVAGLDAQHMYCTTRKTSTIQFSWSDMCTSLRVHLGLVEAARVRLGSEGMAHNQPRSRADHAVDNCEGTVPATSTSTEKRLCEDVPHVAEVSAGLPPRIFDL